MFRRNYKKQNKLLRIILRSLNVYAINKDNFDLAVGNYINNGRNHFKFNDKSFVLSNGYVDLKRKITNLDIIYRYCPSVALWNATKTWKRIVPNIDKKTLIKTSLNSIKNSIIYFLSQHQDVEVTIHLVRDQSENSFDNDIAEILKSDLFKVRFQDSKKSGNHGSFLECCDVASEFGRDLLFFVEDDYVFEKNAFVEMLSSYSKISSMLEEDIFLCPSDYPFYYDSLYETALIMGADYRWRFVGETLLTFMFSKKLYTKYEGKIREVGLKHTHPFEKALHEIYKESPCIAPVGTLAHHISRGIPSVNEDWKKNWDENFISS